MAAFTGDRYVWRSVAHRYSRRRARGSRRRRLRPSARLRDRRQPSRLVLVAPELSRSFAQEPPRNNVELLTDNLQTGMKSVWQNRHGFRYNKVRVLLTRWEADDLGVIHELNMLQHVFSDLYSYDVSTYTIPNHQPDRALKRRVINFLEDDGQNTLLIFYYAGHASLNPNHHDSPVWTANRQPGSPSLHSSGFQSLIEESDCDALLLYDTCHSAALGINPGKASKGVTEVIAACGFEAIAPEVGEHSFTNALVHVLAISSHHEPSSILELHNRILARLRSWAPSPIRNSDGRYQRNQYGDLVMEPQRRRSPIYSNLTPHHNRRGIILAPLSQNKDHSNHSQDIRLRQPLPLVVSGPAGPSFQPRNYHPELTVSIKLADEITNGQHIPDTNAWLEWLRNAPPEAREIEIGIRQSINSKPVNRRSHAIYSSRNLPRPVTMPSSTTPSLTSPGYD